MSFTNASKEAAILAIASTITQASLHTGAAGTTGANEATGGSPAYARKACTFSGGASDGSAVASQVTFDAPAGTYTEVGFWAGSTFVGSLPLTGAVLAVQGQVLVTPTLTAS
jgi:hypothetical protein